MEATAIIFEREKWWQRASKEFLEWASLLAYELIMHVVVYAGLCLSGDRSWKDSLPLAFHDKKQDLPLQAADLFAYHGRQVFVNYKNGEAVYGAWPLVDDLLMKYMRPPTRRRGSING